MLNMHHIISDGWSLGDLIQELGEILEALRQGRSPELKPLPIQYVDYAVWQRQWLEESGTLKQQLAYWQEKLAGVAGESGSGDGLSEAECAELCWGDAGVCAGRATGRAAEIAGRSSRAARCLWCCWLLAKYCCIATRDKTISA